MQNLMRLKTRNLDIITEGDSIMNKDETKGLDVRFYTGKIDISELPSAYKNAESVQNQIEKFGLGEIIDRILPYGCIMAGKQEKFY